MTNEERWRFLEMKRRSSSRRPTKGRVHITGKPEFTEAKGSTREKKLGFFLINADDLND